MGTHPREHHIPTPVEMYWQLTHTMQKLGLITIEQDMSISLTLEIMKPLMEWSITNHERR